MEELIRQAQEQAAHNQQLATWAFILDCAFKVAVIGASLAIIFIQSNTKEIAGELRRSEWLVNLRTVAARSPLKPLNLPHFASNRSSFQ